MEIERRHRPDPEEFYQEFAKPGKPVILTGLAEDWPARGWTPAELARRQPGLEVVLTPSAGAHRDKVTMTLQDYVAYLAAPDERMLYLASWSFQDSLPELLDDFTVPPHFADDWLALLPAELRYELMWIFMGPAGSGFKMHQDVGMTSAWNVQLSGSKEWVFFPPEDTPYLYGGEVDAFNPDHKKFPRYAQATPWTATVRPGELMFTPSAWWHQTRHLETGVALTANYVDRSNHKQVLEWLEEVGNQRPLKRALAKIASQRLLAAARGKS
ncbi:MAG: cupin-like domain-containing protein [Candidatus Eremiobacteraeota bacterium]|nr:cupin-like domain-containing protein [Candidatus Eremiobacteraeota bacterium]